MRRRRAQLGFSRTLWRSRCPIPHTLYYFYTSRIHKQIELVWPSSWPKSWRQVCSTALASLPLNISSLKCCDWSNMRWGRKYLSRHQKLVHCIDVCVCILYVCGLFLWALRTCNSADTFDSDFITKIVSSSFMNRDQRSWDAADFWKRPKVKTWVLYVWSVKTSFPIVMLFIIKRRTMYRSWARRPSSSGHASFLGVHCSLQALPYTCTPQI